VSWFIVSLVSAVSNAWTLAWTGWLGDYRRALGVLVGTTTSGSFAMAGGGRTMGSWTVGVRTCGYGIVEMTRPVPVGMLSTAGNEDIGIMLFAGAG
jgi:hypothetical protein